MCDIIVFECYLEDFKFKINKNKLNELISLESLETDYNIVTSYYPSEDELSEIIFENLIITSTNKEKDRFEKLRPISNKSLIS
jgi:hypothetical protein